MNYRGIWKLTIFPQKSFVPILKAALIHAKLVHVNILEIIKILLIYFTGKNNQFPFWESQVKSQIDNPTLGITWVLHSQIWGFTISFTD